MDSGANNSSAVPLLASNMPRYFPSNSLAYPGIQEGVFPVGSISEAPYQGCLLQNDEFVGGAVLIDERWALTAAHCLDYAVESLDKLEVKFGTVDLTASVKKYKVKGFKKHPWYNWNNEVRGCDNDIALLKLLETVEMRQEFIWPVTLDYFGSSLSPGTPLQVTGWGKDPSSVIPSLLKKATIVVQDPNEAPDCIKKGLTENMFLAGLKSDQCYVDITAGDSGGPVILKQGDGTHVLIGLVSWKNKYKKGYGIYTKVSQYLTWIEESLRTTKKIYMPTSPPPIPYLPGPNPFPIPQPLPPPPPIPYLPGPNPFPIPQPLPPPPPYFYGSPPQ